MLVGAMAACGEPSPDVARVMMSTAVRAAIDEQLTTEVRWHRQTSDAGETYYRGELRPSQRTVFHLWGVPSVSRAEAVVLLSASGEPDDPRAMLIALLIATGATDAVEWATALLVDPYVTRTWQATTSANGLRVRLERPGATKFGGDAVVLTIEPEPLTSAPAS